jgi:Glycosyl hydrolases family 16
MHTRIRLVLAFALPPVLALLGCEPIVTEPNAVTVIQDSLGPAYVTAGHQAVADLRLHSDECVQTQAIGVAVRNAAGDQFDFPGAVNGVRLCPAGYHFTSQSRTFAQGTYTMFGFWQDTSGAYHNLPSVTLTVGAASSTLPPPPSPPPPPPPPTGNGPSWDPNGAWNARFSDEFDDTTVDATKWRRGWFSEGISSPVNSAETACYDSAHVTESGGSLHLELTSQSSICGGSTKPRSGALVSSNPSDGRASGGFEFTFGAIEFRAWIPPGSGNVINNWPALWTVGQDWPGAGENDVFEGLGGHACWHFHSSITDRGECPTGSYAGWHTFGAHWEPGRVRWYYDGQPVGTLTTGITSAPHYIVMDNTTGTWGGPVSTPADMQIDYVRVWQR